MQLDLLRNCARDFCSLWKVAAKSNINMTDAKEMGKKLRSIEYVEVVESSWKVRNSPKTLSVNPRHRTTLMIRITEKGKTFLKAWDVFRKTFPEFYGLGLND